MSPSDIDTEQVAKDLWERFLAPTLGSTDTWATTSDHLRETSRLLVSAVIAAISEQSA